MQIDKLKEIISNSKNIVFFGGAGVSTESRILDFRSKNGIYKTISDYGESPEVILSHKYFINNTKTFYKYYKENMIHSNASPNFAHLELSKLEKAGKLKVIITPNIDGVHQIAGSKNVLELHGSLKRNYCIDCNKYYDINHIVNSENIPKCSCGGIIKPDVVLYQENLNTDLVNLAIDYIANADTLIVGGTSLIVYPAASLVDYYSGEKLVLINKSETGLDSSANLVINESIGKVFKQLKIK